MEAGTNQKDRQQSHLPFLDGLRGMMALWVVMGHVLSAMGASLPILSQPGLAVDVFMIISGLLMAYYFRLRQDKEAWESPATWRAFYLRRFFRIAPAYYLVLVVDLLVRHQVAKCAYVALTSFPRPHGAPALSISPNIEALQWVGVLTHLTFTFGAFTKTTLSTMLPDWSISLEMQFYLALPFIMLFYRRAGHVVSTLLLVAAWVFANRLFSFGHDMSPRPFGHYPMPSFLPLKLNCFVIGILLAESLYFKKADVRKSGLLCLLALGVACTLDKYVILLSCFSALLLLYRGETAPAAIRGGLAAVRSILGSRPCVFLADTSYGVYLFHLLVLWPMAAWLAGHEAIRRLPGVERFGICLTMLLLIAYPTGWAMHKFIEQPGIALGKRFLRGKKAVVRAEIGQASRIELPEAATVSP